MPDKPKSNYEIADDAVAALPPLTNEQAAWVIARIMSKYDLTGTVFTPEDVRSYIQNAFDADEVNREVTDHDVEAMLGTWEWRKGISSYLTEEGGEMLQTAYNDTFDSEGNIRSEEVA